MTSDPHPSRTLAGDVPRVASDADRHRLSTDLGELELRLALFDDRFERFVRRAEPDHLVWRSDTVARMRALAERAARLQRAAALPAAQRDRVAAVLWTLRHRLGVLDRRRAEQLPAVHQRVR